MICQVPEATQEEMKAATDAASKAFKTWKEVPVQHRQRVMLKLQALIRENTDELALSITKEQGKTIPDARGDVFRGLGKKIYILHVLCEDVLNSLYYLICRGC